MIESGTLYFMEQATHHPDLRYCYVVWNNPSNHYQALFTQPIKHHNTAQLQRRYYNGTIAGSISSKSHYYYYTTTLPAEQAIPAIRQKCLSLQVLKPRCARRWRSDTIIDVLVCTLVAKLCGPATA